MHILINLVLAVLAYLFTVWLLGYVGLPEVVVILLGLVVAFLVFQSNTAARLR